MSWEPIDTAPKDGTVIMVYANQGKWWNGIHVARWRDELDGGRSWGHKWIVAEYQNLGSNISGYVTHWMPLPKPPSS